MSTTKHLAKNWRKRSIDATTLTTAALLLAAAIAYGILYIRRMSSVSREYEAIKEDLEAIAQYVRRTLQEMEERIAQLASRVEELEKKLRAEAFKPSPSVRKVPVAKPSAEVTPTEVEILQHLLLEGEKTSADIRGIINRSREHTARLLKKLFEEGFVERDTTKTPFRYRITEKGKKLLESLSQSQ